MISTTDFEYWLSAEAPDGREEIHALYLCVRDRKPGAFYSVQKFGEKTCVVGQTTTLDLASEKVRRGPFV